MPATEAKWAMGTTLKRNDVIVGEVKTIGDVVLNRASADATHLLSPGGFDEFVLTRKNVGDVPITFNFVPGDAGQTGLLDAYQNGTRQTFQIVFPDALGTTWDFEAVVMSFSTTGISPEGLLGGAATLKFTGLPVLGVTYSDGLTTPFFAISESAVVVPTKAGNVYEYVATVLTDVSSVTVTPTAAAGVITVNGSTVATGEASSAITLGAAGSVTTITVKVKETGKAARTYTIKVARAAS